MTSLNAAITYLFALLMQPFKHAAPVVSLTILSIVTGAIMGVIFKKTTDQGAIAAAKARMQGRLIEIRLFSGDPVIVLRSAMRIIIENAIYLRYVLPAMIVMIIPVALILVQISGYFSHRPAMPGEPVAVTAQLSGGNSIASDENISLIAPPGVKIETPVLYAPSLNQASWRISGQRPGASGVTVVFNGIHYSKNFSTGAGLEKAWPSVSSGGFFRSLLNPAEPPLQKITPGVREITIDYPERALGAAGRNVNWLLFFLIVSILTSFLLKPVLKIEM